MAGSFEHVTNDDGSFRGVELIDNLGDAYEALEEMHAMIWWLAKRLDEHTDGELWEPEGWIERAVRHAQEEQRARS